MATVALYRTILLLALPCQKRLTSKIAYSNFTPKDCVSLKKSLQALPAVKQLVSVCRSKILKDIFVGHGDSCKKRIKISAITIFRDNCKKTQTVAFVTNSIDLIINYCAVTWHRLF